MAKATTAAQYITGLDRPKAEIVRAVRAIVQAAVPKAVESIKWGRPVYEINGIFCALKAHSKHVSVIFWRGQELKKICPDMTGEGVRMGHLKIASLEEIDAKMLTRLCREAARLNMAKADHKLRRKK